MRWRLAQAGQGMRAMLAPRAPDATRVGDVHALTEAHRGAQDGLGALGAPLGRAGARAGAGQGRRGADRRP